MTSLKIEIEQKAPFSSLEEETLLNLLRTSDCLHRRLQLEVRAWGVTSTQYNVLRILRGAQPQGLTCAAIGSHMVTAEPDLTRLLGRLKTLKLVRQQRDRRDRRKVWTQITDAGLELLKAMDPAVQHLPKALLGSMKAEELSELNRLLESARQSSSESPTPK
jgi:MarR family transcriptional regulator, 2-MHQ and catechol-resistance regulon repressor